MNIIPILENYKSKVDQKLELFLEKKIKKAAKLSPEALKFVKQIKEFVLRGGKKIRAALVCEGYKGIGGKNKKAILNASMGIELIHAYLLMHDDIIDRDDLRRGKPTLHKIFAKSFSNSSINFQKRKSDYLGVSQSLVAGDITSSFGSEAIFSCGLDFKNVLNALDKLSEIIKCVSYGQILDILLKTKKKVTEQDILKVYKYKTAKYTIEGPLHIGALLGTGTKKDLEQFSLYAIPLGIAFQIQDDILGLFSKKKGKPPTAELKQGSQTILIVKALEKANKNQKNIILNALGNQNVTLKQVQQVREIIKDTGSLDYSTKKARKLAEKSITEINNTKFGKSTKEFLAGIAEYIINREY